jgi:putative polymerase
MDFLNWLGFHGPKNVTSSFDSGYTYAVGIIGITGFSVLWLTFLTIKAPGPQFFLFRTLSAFYLALILCVSYSPFTIKTAALLWFLLGALAPRNTAQLSEQSRSTNLRPPLGYKIPIS